MVSQEPGSADAGIELVLARCRRLRIAKGVKELLPDQWKAAPARR